MSEIKEDINKSENINFEKPILLPNRVKLIGKRRILATKSFKNARKLNIKKNNAKYLVNIICLGIYIHRWKYQTKALKYATKGYNKRRANLRKAFSKITNVYYKLKFEIDKNIFDIFKQLPPREGVNHDFRFWKLKFVNNEILDANAQKKLKFWSKLNYLLLANRHLYKMTLNGLNNMKKNHYIEIDNNENKEKDD
jgi:hypothetical protein